MAKGFLLEVCGIVVDKSLVVTLVAYISHHPPRAFLCFPKQQLRQQYGFVVGIVININFRNLTDLWNQFFLQSWVDVDVFSHLSFAHIGR